MGSIDNTELSVIMDMADAAKFPHFDIGVRSYAVIWTSHGRKRANLRTSGHCTAAAFLKYALKKVGKEQIAPLTSEYVWLIDRLSLYDFCLAVNPSIERIRVVNCGKIFDKKNPQNVLYPYKNERVIDIGCDGEVREYRWEFKKEEAA